MMMMMRRRRRAEGPQLLVVCVCVCWGGGVIRAPTVRQPAVATYVCVYVYMIHQTYEKVCSCGLSFLQV